MRANKYQMITTTIIIIIIIVTITIPNGRWQLVPDRWDLGYEIWSSKRFGAAGGGYSRKARVGRINIDIDIDIEIYTYYLSITCHHRSNWNTIQNMHIIQT